MSFIKYNFTRRQARIGVSLPWIVWHWFFVAADLALREALGGAQLALLQPYIYMRWQSIVTAPACRLSTRPRVGCFVFKKLCILSVF